MKRFFQTSHLGFVLFPLFLVSCTTGISTNKGSVTPGVNRLPVDAEPIQGRNEKAFYSSLSKNTGSVLLYETTQLTGRLFQLKDGKVTGSKNFSASEIVASQDTTALVVKGENNVFEFSDLKADKVFSGESSLPDSTLSALCFPAPFGLAQSRVGNTQYSDFRIQNERLGYQFVGLKNNQLESIGGGGLVQFRSLLSELSFTKAGFGSVHVHRMIPHQSNPLFLYSAFSIDTSYSDPGFAGATNLYCQVDPRIMGVEESITSLMQTGQNQFSATSTANNLANIAGGTANEPAWNAFPFQAPFLKVMDTNGQGVYLPPNTYSQYLALFDFRFAIPGTAKITQIRASLTRRQETCVGTATGVIEEGAYLYNMNSKQLLSPNAAKAIQLPTYYTTETYTLASGPVTGPGVLSPALVNSPDFGFVVRYYNNTNCDRNSPKIEMINVTVTYVEN